MEMRTAFLPVLILVIAAPTASALALPSLVGTCLSSPLATCLDSVSPRVKASNLLPDAMVPDEPPAPEEAQTSPAPGTSDAAAEPADQQGAPGQTSTGAEPAQEPAGPFVPPAPVSDTTGEAAPGALGLGNAFVAMSLIVVLAALALVLFIMVLDRSRSRAPKSARLVDAARAHAMQEDIEEAWTRARAAR